MGRYYKLVDKKVVACSALEVESINNRVAIATVGNVQISTIFLGINHNLNDSCVPVVFETMVFDGRHDGYCERYSTWQDAVAEHKKIKMWIRMEQFTGRALDFDTAVIWMKHLKLI